MLMYLELSRPRGEVGRWPKVFERLSLFNEFVTYGINSANKFVINDMLELSTINEAEEPKRYAEVKNRLEERQETYRDNSSDAEVVRKKFTIHKCSCGHTLYKKIDPNDSVIYCDSCKREIELDIVPGRYTCPNCGFMSSKNIRIGIEKGLAEPEVIEMNCSVCRGPVDLFYNKEKDNYFSERVCVS